MRMIFFFWRRKTVFEIYIPPAYPWTLNTYSYNISWFIYSVYELSSKPFIIFYILHLSSMMKCPPLWIGTRYDVSPLVLDCLRIFLTSWRHIHHACHISTLYLSLYIRYGISPRRRRPSMQHSFIMTRNYCYDKMNERTEWTERAKLMEGVLRRQNLACCSTTVLWTDSNTSVWLLGYMYKLIQSIWPFANIMYVFVHHVWERPGSPDGRM